MMDLYTTDPRAMEACRSADRIAEDASDEAWSRLGAAIYALNPAGQPFTLAHRLILEPLGAMVRPSCACGAWRMSGYVKTGTAHALFGSHCTTGR